MRKLKKRLLAWVLCVCLLLPECSTTALAAEAISDVQIAEETTASEKEPQEETTPEKTTAPEEMKEGEETESPVDEETALPTQTPATDVAPSVTPSEMPAESPVQTEAPSELPTATPGISEAATPDIPEAATPTASETPFPTEVPVELEKASEAVELTLDTYGSVKIATGGEAGWAKFTAAEEGDYIFYTDTNSRYNSALYAQMTDETAVLECAPIRYSSGAYAVYHMNAGETVYWKLAYYAYSTGTIKAYVKKKIGFPGTIQNVKINKIPYGFEIELTWLIGDSENIWDWKDNTYGVGGAPMSLVYSADSTADFSSVEKMMKISATNIGSVPDGIKTIPFECIDYSDSDHSATMKVTTADDAEMSADTEYQFAVFANVNNSSQGYNGVYWWDNVHSGTATTGTGTEATQVSFDENNFVAEAGYAYAKGSAAISNPANESIIEKGFYVAKDSEPAEKKPVEYWKDETAGVFEGSYLFGTAGSCTLTPYAEVRVGKEGTITEIKGTPKTVTKKDPSEIKDIFKVEPATAGAAVTAKFDLQNKADSSLRVVYTIMDADGNTVNSDYIYAYVTDGVLSFDEIIPEGSNALTGGVNYKVKLVLANTYLGNKDYEELYSKEFEFTPKEIVTYTEADIPDEALRAILLKKIKSDVLTSDKLEKITSLYIYGDSELNSVGAVAAVKSLKGIEYLPNLENLTIRGQDIKDISMLPSLKKLERAGFSYNDIEKIPDFSQNENLSYLDLQNNLIAREEFTADKFSEKIKQNQKDLLTQQQRSSTELSINFSEVYYNNLEGKTTLAFEVEGGKYQRNLEFTVTVGETEYKIPDTNSYSSSRDFTVETDLAAGEYPVTMEVLESFGGREKKIAEEAIAVKKPEQKAFYQKYLGENQYSLDVNDVLIPYSADSEKVTDLKLVDKSGNTVGIKNDASLDNYASSNDVMPGVFSNNFEVAPKCFWNVYGSIYLVSKGLSGSLDLVVSTSEGKTYTFTDYALTEYKNPLVTRIYRSSDYDNEGDYFYLEVRGEGLNYDAFYPVLMLADGTEVTEYVSYIGRYSDEAVYKLKKLSGFPENTEVAVKIVTKNGYDEVKCLDGLTVYTSTGKEVIDLVYNAKTKEYILYASSELKEGTTLSWILCSEWPDYDWNQKKFKNYGTIYGTAELAYTGNKTIVDFRDEKGNFCEYFRNHNRYYGVSWKEDGSDEYSYGSVGYRESGFGVYEQVDTTQLSFTGERYQTVSKQIAAEFTAYNNALYKEGDVLKLTLSKYDAGTGSYINVPGAETDMTAVLNEVNKTAVFTASFTSETMFEEGGYLLTVKNQEGQWLAGADISVVADSIYQQSQSYGSVSLTNGSETRVRIYASLYMKNGFDKSKLSYEFYDLQGNKVTGWNREKFTDDNNSNIEGYHYMVAEFSNLYDRYHYLYCRILYDGKLISSIVSPSVTYYKYRTDSGCSEEYGQKIYLNSGVSFSYETGVGMYAVSSTFVSDYTVGIYADETAEPITSFTVPTKGYYQFTGDDLSKLIEVDPDLEGLYTLVAKKKGVILETVRYVNVGYKKVTKNPEAIKLDKTKVTLSKGDTMALQVTITPADANTTRTWKSDNENVATVLNGTITAVGVGTANITATTVNGRTATCKVTVVDYSISETKLTLNVGDEHTLSILNGTEEVKANWTTSDGTVAVVDAATGKVKAMGKGEATITAKVSEDCSFTCKVTVTSELKEIVLKGSRDILEIGDTDQLTIIFTPASEEKGSIVSYESSDPAVVTVDENGKVAAVGVGQATITAIAHSEGSEKQCEDTFTYTVCESDKADPIQAEFFVHAITNVDGTLAALANELPDKWEWADGTVNLAAFAGMEKKEFAVTHTNVNTGEVQWDTVTVKFSTIENISLLREDGEAVPKNLATNDVETIVRADYSVLGEDIDDRLDGLNLDWQLLSNNNIVETKINADGTGSLKGLKAGKTTLTLNLTANGEPIESKQLKMSVVDSKKKGIADVAVILVDREGNEISKDNDGKYVIQKSDEVYLKNNTAPKADNTAYKITYKTSDAGVVKIGKAVSTDKTKTALTLMSAGKVQIQAVADDTLKSTQNIAVIIEDRTAAGVSLSQNTVTINTVLKDDYQGAEIKVYAGFETLLENAELTGIDGAEVSVTEDGDGIIIHASQPGTGILTLWLNGIEKAISFTVKVKTVNKAPALTVKQVVKLNDLYKEGYAKFSIGSAGEEITDVTVKGLENGDYEYDVAAGTLTIMNAENQKYTVSAEFEKYDSVEKEISVAREKESFKLSAANVLIYTDSIDKKVSLQLLDKRTGLPVDLSDATVTADVSGSGEYTAEADADKVFLTLTADKVPSAKGDKVTLTFKKDGWRSDVSQTVTVKPATLSKAALQLGQKKLTLYNYKGMSASVSTSISLKGCGEAEELFTKLAIVEVPNKKLPAVKDKTLKITCEDGMLTFAKNGEELKAGTYKFNLELSDKAFAKTLKTSVSLKVIDVDMGDEKKCAAVTVSKSGSIDVLNREGSMITLKPKFRNVAKSARVENIVLTGRDAHLFEITGRSGNNVTLQLKNDSNVITKYGYKVKVNYLILSGDTTLRLTSKPVEIKLTQKKPKVKVTGEGVYSNTVAEGKPIVFAIANSAGVKLSAAKIELLNYTKDFVYDAENGLLMHELNGQTAKGKSYTLKFNVYPEGRGDNEKPVTVKYKVKIAK